MRDEVVGHVPFHVGVNVSDAEVLGDRLQLTLRGDAEPDKTLVVDHVIAATGYEIDLRRLPFLRESLLQKVRTVHNEPLLTSNFETSVAGLYIVGPAAANSFGPLLRFAYGAGFTARRLTHHLAASRVRVPLANVRAQVDA